MKSILRNPGAQLLEAPGLYVPPVAHWGPGPVRGGVPVIFPQFNRVGPGRKHGTARDRDWALSSPGPDGGGMAQSAQLSLGPDDGFLGHVQLTVLRQGPSTEVALHARSTAPVAQPFGAALHTYCLVKDVEACTVTGLQALPYLDCIAGERIARPADQAPLRPQGELDRVYAIPPETRSAWTTVQVQTPTGLLEVACQGFANIVVWNPGEVLGTALQDIPPGDWQRFLCIEAAHIYTDVDYQCRPSLGPDATWAGRQRFTWTPQARG